MTTEVATIEEIKEKFSFNAEVFIGEPSYIQFIKHPINVEGLHTRPAGPAPELGQHSEEILAELGYRVQDIAQMKEQGII